MSNQYYACGKLLITGEYLVLRGARGLALPTSRGQYLSVHPCRSSSSYISWVSKDCKNEVWFSCDLDRSLDVLSSTNDAIASRLQVIFAEAKKMNEEFLDLEESIEVETALEFHRDWGLGSSSTLISLIAQWSQVDSYQLLQNTLGGSGYDVKVAEMGSPIVFERTEYTAIATTVEFDPSFKDHIWFIYTGYKMDSASEVGAFSDLEIAQVDIDHISRLTKEVLSAEKLTEFERLLSEHDLLLSRILARPSASDVYSDYTKGHVKYLGAWGGDFMLATGEEIDINYFRERGMETILTYDQMIAE